MDYDQGGGFVKSEVAGGSGGGDGVKPNKSIAIVNSSHVANLTFGNNITIHRQKFQNLTMIGKVQDFAESSTKFEFNLKDCEGPAIKVQKWRTNANNQSNGGDMETERPIEESWIKNGSLVRIFGNPRKNANSPDPFIIAYQILPVTDLNEVIMHNLETVMSSIVLEKRKNNILSGLPPTAGFPNSASTDVGILGKSQPQSARKAAAQQQGESGIPGMKQAEAAVLRVINSCIDDNGISKEQLSKSLRQLNMAAIEKSLDFLATEGHIYTTIDDNHYKSTEG